VRGEFSPVPLALALAVVCWVAGFDVIYACQDVEFDRAQGLHSIPARLGAARALLVARALHVLAVGFLISLWWLVPLHPVYLFGVGAVAVLFAYEHSLVRPTDLSRIDAAFFTVNGWVSVGYLAAALAAVRLR
jgi:4-hydroxybenzoate polyprenyltransferase